jgi:hypothetical protein
VNQTISYEPAPGRRPYRLAGELESNISPRLPPAVGSVDEVTLVDRLREMVENGRVGEARRLLAASGGEGGSAVAGWERALALPDVRVLPSATAPDMRPNARWLSEHAASHEGRWVALHDGVLVAAGESLAHVRNAVRDAGDPSVIFINLKASRE